MFRNHRTLEEEKVESSQKITPYESYSTNINIDNIDNIENNTPSIINQNNAINSSTIKTESNNGKNSFKRSFDGSLNNKKEEDINKSKPNTNIRSNNTLNHQTINNKVFKTINITNKNPKKNILFRNQNLNLKLVTLNKDELYNAFIFFQSLISRDENDNINNVDYIKNKLFEFASTKKHNFFSETIEYNDNFDENENISDIQNYMPIYYKSDRNPIINSNANEENNINLIKNYSFSYSNNSKNKILRNNTRNSLSRNMKNTIKSNSQIFNEYLLIDGKMKDKTLSPEKSKSFHHNYSFDIRNKEKTELSFNSIHEKDKTKDKCIEIENNDILKYYNNYNINSTCDFNSYRKELEHTSPLDNRLYKERILGKNFKKYTIEEDSAFGPSSQKIKKLKRFDSAYNSTKRKANCIDLEDSKIKKYLSKNNLINEKIIISPTKSNVYKDINSENKKNKYNLESKQPENVIHEIKVNKKKSLNNKEQLIGEKIKELNDEIKKFKEERNKVTLLKEEYEKLQTKLLKDIKDFNIKKNIYQKNNKGDFDKFKGVSQTETKLIMSITQHNQSLIVSNNKKKEIIKLLKSRISELENIIKVKNNDENNKKIFQKVYELNKNFESEHINIFTKKNKNTKKKNDESYLLKRARFNLKKNIGSNSSEKIKRNKFNNETINQTINNNINRYFDISLNKNMLKVNNKKIMNISYNQQNIKNNILNSRLVNNNNPNINFKKFYNNFNSNQNLIKKSVLNNNINSTSINNRNNSINTALLNNQKVDKEVYHTNLNIYEKLINKQREKDKNSKKINININSERDLYTKKKSVKELKIDILEKNRIKYDKGKKFNLNFNISDTKSSIKKYQKSQGKSLITNRLESKNDASKKKANLNILNSSKVKPKNYSNNKKNTNVIRSLTRNTTTIAEIDKCKDLKETNNSLDNQEINKTVKTSINNKCLNNNINDNIEEGTIFSEEEENDKLGYDFIIPEKYKNYNGEITNTIDNDGKIINIYDDNKKEIIFKSGVRKEIYIDGYQLIHFPNGDIKQKFVGKEEKIVYYYKDTSTVQTTFKSGLNVFKFSNGQIEKHYPDGSRFIIYANGIKRKMSKNGKEEMIIPEEQNKVNNEENNKENENHKDNELYDSRNVDKIEEFNSEKNINNKNDLLLSFIDIEQDDKK